MRNYISVCLVFSLALLLSFVHAEENSLDLLPACAQKCVSGTLSGVKCHSFAPTDLSCICPEATLLSEAKACFSTSCGRKDTLIALNATRVVCNEPIRDKSVSYRISNIAFFSLAMVAMAAQWTARATVGRLQWLDDGNMVVVLICNTVLFAVGTKMSYTGLGKDMWNIPFPDINNTLLLFWVSEIAYFSTLGFIKIAFLLFFLQIFPEKRFRRIVWSVVVFGLASTIAFALAAVFVCSPISFAWKQWDGESKGQCINNNSLAFTHAAFSIFLDFVTLSLPITQIWNLHLAMKKKIGVLLMFSVGAFVTVVSMLRLRSLVHFANTTDMTWDYLEASLWSILECQVGIICACMPSIRLGLTRLFPKLLGSSNNSVSKDAYGKGGTGATGGRSRSQGPHSVFNPNEISVQTTFKVSHGRKGPKSDDDERSFVQLVEIDADSKRSDTS